MKLWKNRIGRALIAAALALGPALPALAHAEDGDGVGGFGGMMGGWSKAGAPHGRGAPRLPALLRGQRCK